MKNKSFALSFAVFLLVTLGIFIVCIVEGDLFEFFYEYAVPLFIILLFTGIEIAIAKFTKSSLKKCLLQPICILKYTLVFIYILLIHYISSIIPNLLLGFSPHVATILFCSLFFIASLITTYVFELKAITKL